MPVKQKLKAVLGSPRIRSRANLSERVDRSKQIFEGGEDEMQVGVQLLSRKESRNHKGERQARTKVQVKAGLRMERDQVEAETSVRVQNDESYAGVESSDDQSKGNSKGSRGQVLKAKKASEDRCHR